MTANFGSLIWRYSVFDGWRLFFWPFDGWRLTPSRPSSRAKACNETFKFPGIERWNQESRFSKSPYLFRRYFLLFWRNNRIVTSSLLPKLAFRLSGVKAYATMPIGNMGRKSLALIDWGSRCFPSTSLQRIEPQSRTRNPHFP